MNALAVMAPLTIANLTSRVSRATPELVPGDLRRFTEGAQPTFQTLGGDLL
jgi:hypothetical protein